MIMHCFSLNTLLIPTNLIEILEIIVNQNFKLNIEGYFYKMSTKNIPNRKSLYQQPWLLGKLIIQTNVLTV